ncbi:MAG: hypothetical protein ACTS2F_16215 [Thainema sp.]
MGKLKSIPQDPGKFFSLMAAEMQDFKSVIEFHRKNTQSCIACGCTTLRKSTDNFIFLAIMAVEIASTTMISIVGKEVKIAEAGGA